MQDTELVVLLVVAHIGIVLIVCVSVCLYVYFCERKCMLEFVAPLLQHVNHASTTVYDTICNLTDVLRYILGGESSLQVD